MLKRLLCLLVLLVASPAVFAQQEVIRTVWRVDSRPPSEVLEHGFRGTGVRLDLLGHVLGGSCALGGAPGSSAWVSTFADRGDALRFAEHLLRSDGYSGFVWLYEIRADDEFLYVRSLARQVIDAAEEGIYGYLPQHASRMREVMQTTLLGMQREVVALRVAPSNIRTHASMRLGGVDGIEIDLPRANPGYVDADTRASFEVNSPQVYLPVDSLMASYNAHAPSCAMSCDGASTSPSRTVATPAPSPEMCIAYRQNSMTVEKLMLLLD